MDAQISHVIVEIVKFEKKEQEITTDLDKLIYLMKNLEEIKGIDELPKFLTEDWIEQAMEKLDKSKMTIDQRMQYEMMMAKNASIIEMIKEEKKKITKEIAKEEGEKGEKRKALDAGKKLKDLGTEIDVIIHVTGLTKEEIEKL